MGIALYLKHANTTINSCIERSIQFHSEWICTVCGIATDTLYDSLQLFYIIHYHLNTILYRIQCCLRGRERVNHGYRISHDL